MTRQTLLVEGIADQSFYEIFCKKHGLHPEVRVAKPRDFGGLKNTKQGAINLLTTLLPMLGDGQLERLALIVDADQAQDGGGFAKTVEQVAAILTPFGFLSPPVVFPQGGLLFKHGDGLADFGLWVMPDNQAEGALEDWLLRSIRADEQPLLVHAKSAVGTLAAPKFKPARRVKSEVATWLAWQAKPGEGLYYTVDAGLLDESAPLYGGLRDWLHAVFR